MGVVGYSEDCGGSAVAGIPQRTGRGFILGRMMRKLFTEAEIEAGKTPAGGFTRKQLAKWGVPWPPPKGWRKAITKKGDAPSVGLKSAFHHQKILNIVDSDEVPWDD